MKSSILALLVFLTGALAQANSEMPRKIYDCDQKHGRHHATIYQVERRFFICFSRGHGPTVAPTDELTILCRDKVWSEDWDHKDDMIMIDFQRGWMFEGDRKGGVLWNDRTSFMCDRVHGDHRP